MLLVAIEHAWTIGVCGSSVGIIACRTRVDRPSHLLKGVCRARHRCIILFTSETTCVPSLFLRISSSLVFLKSPSASFAASTRVLNMLGAVPSRHPKYRSEWSGSNQGEQRLITMKAKLCRNLVNGGCPFGQKCSFLHPAPRITGPPSFTRSIFSWNTLLLPQLLALSNQQGTRKMMPRRSPPPPQGPELIDEDPSPSTSLLLSKSDCTSLDQVPQTRRSSKRKKYPCRHFIRTGGWCPAGGQCRL